MKLTWGDRMEADRLCVVLWVEEGLYSSVASKACWCLHLCRHAHSSVYLWNNKNAWYKNGIKNIPFITHIYH